MQMLHSISELYFSLKKIDSVYRIDHLIDNTRTKFKVLNVGKKKPTLSKRVNECDIEKDDSIKLIKLHTHRAASIDLTRSISVSLLYKQLLLLAYRISQW